MRDAPQFVWLSGKSFSLNYDCPKRWAGERFALTAKTKWHLKILFIFIWLANFKRTFKVAVWLLLWKQTQNDSFRVHFSFVELRLSKQISKKSSLTFALKVKPNWWLKVFFIFIDLRLSKSPFKLAIWLLLWKQIQTDSWKSFSFSLLKEAV